MENLIGKKFNRLQVLKFDHKDKYYNSYWLCKCDCGNYRIVSASGLRYGHTKSCGCYQKEQSTKLCKSRATHNCSKSRLYHIWTGIKQRCLNPNNPDYKKWYGGHGVKVCEGWKESFENFQKWALSHGYNDNLSIDRIDSKGNYEPKNCRWETSRNQANNTSRNHKITYKNKTQTVAEWARQLKISSRTLLGRLTVYKWDIKKALTTKPKKGGHKD